MGRRDEPISFYTPSFHFLSNFSAFRVVFRNVRYPTVEHAYQANKFIRSSRKIAVEILNAPSPYEAKRIARENKKKMDPNFYNYNLGLMKQLIVLKVEQNPYVKDKLLKTQDALIAERTYDSFWGVGENGQGRNELGKIWMEIREHLKSNEKGITY